MSRHSLRLALLVPLLSAALAACDRRSPQELAAERQARQAACIGEELANAARNKREDLETIIRNAQAQGSPMATMMRGPLSFAESYAAHAETQQRVLALADSAGRVEARDDSTRLAGEAAALARGLPAAPPGTVQGNVAAQYSREFQAARRNPDHPCSRPQEEQ